MEMKLTPCVQMEKVLGLRILNVKSNVRLLAKIIKFKLLIHMVKNYIKNHIKSNQLCIKSQTIESYCTLCILNWQACGRFFTLCTVKYSLFTNSVFEDWNFEYWILKFSHIVNIEKKCWARSNLKNKVEGKRCYIEKLSTFEGDDCQSKCFMNLLLFLQKYTPCKTYKHIYYIHSHPFKTKTKTKTKTKKPKPF